MVRTALVPTRSVPYYRARLAVRTIPWPSGDVTKTYAMMKFMTIAVAVLFFIVAAVAGIGGA